MKRALLKVFIAVGVLAILVVIFWPVRSPSHEPTRRSMCQANLKQIGLGFIQYTQDHNDVLPPATTRNSSGWADVLQPYIKSWQLFQCPSTSDKTYSSPSSDYFFNARLSRGYTPNLSVAALTILSGEGEDQAPTWANLTQLPPQWALDETSPTWRHIDTANYLFADGHVKSFKPGKITNASPEMGIATFAVR